MKNMNFFAVSKGFMSLKDSDEAKLLFIYFKKSANYSIMNSILYYITFNNE